jgi:hypothetical protein
MSNETTSGLAVAPIGEDTFRSVIAGLPALGTGLKNLELVATSPMSDASHTRQWRSITPGMPSHDYIKREPANVWCRASNAFCVRVKGSSSYTSSSTSAVSERLARIAKTMTISYGDDTVYVFASNQASDVRLGQAAFGELTGIEVAREFCIAGVMRGPCTSKMVQVTHTGVVRELGGVDDEMSNLLRASRILVK